jgi:aspartyl/asparaginyl beta-hydroxylase (cupin superfamily)
VDYHLPEIVEALRRGGYYDRVMARGAELDRVKEYLRRWTGERPSPADPVQHPHYPLFPGLRHQPFHDPRAFPAATILEREFATIRGEALALDDDAHVDYTRAAGMKTGAGSWTLYLFHHMGVEVESVAHRCPATLAVIESLPRACTGYAWGDALFSAMKGGTHLHPHCSTDNLRVRLHLGIEVPEGCLMRVAGETRSWEEGKVLAFEDSFEHEVWNRSGRRRVVLIVDLWHPDLTDIEIRALTAAFGKSEVRSLFVDERIGLTPSPGAHLRRIRAVMAQQDESPLVREFWPA